jgi:hypothetical protein
MRFLIVCILLLLIIPIVDAQCQGNMRFVIEPSFAPPSSHVSPSVSELTNCDGTTVNFILDSCSGSPISSCTVAGGGCEGTSFSVPSSSGAYTYHACAVGKETSLIYMVGYSSLPDFTWTGIIQIISIASIIFLFLLENHNKIGRK